MAFDRSFHYCNTNYALLALIIEKVGGMPYPQFIYENFFFPFGMTNSYVFTMADSAKALPLITIRTNRKNSRSWTRFMAIRMYTAQ